MPTASSVQFQVEVASPHAPPTSSQTVWGMSSPNNGMAVQASLDPKSNIEMYVMSPTGTAIMSPTKNSIHINQIPVALPGPGQYAMVVKPSHPLRMTESIDPGHIQVLYHAQLSKRGCCASINPMELIQNIANLNVWKILGTFTCDCLCYHKIRDRGYVAVHENRVESNYPTVACWGLVVKDNVKVEYFDRLPGSIKHASSCTPYHLCCCVAWSGEVVATAPMDALNCCACSCLRAYYPKLENGAAFATALDAARTAWKDGSRLVKAPAPQIMS